MKILNTTSEGKDERLKLKILAPFDVIEQDKKDDISEEIQRSYDRIYLTYWKEILENKNYGNIALTGNYGTGKTTMIDYVIKEGLLNKRNVARISVLRFFNQDEPSVFESHDKNDIALKILQELYYQTKISLRIYNDKTVFFNRWLHIAFGLMLMFIILSCCFYLFFHSADFNILGILNSVGTMGILLIVSGSLLIACLLYVQEKSKVLKELNVFNQKIGMDEKKQERDLLIEGYINEIIHLLKVQNIQFIIFEDMDRVNDLDIFSELRRINFLIHQSPAMRKKDLRFIYLVRDDLLKNEKDRTKFFDIILPLVPIIVNSNSIRWINEYFDCFFEKEKDDYNKMKLFSIIAYPIDDLRILNDMRNEFMIYLDAYLLKKYNDKFDPMSYFCIPEELEKKGTFSDRAEILSLMLYKVLLPADFSLLQNNQGLLFFIIDFKMKNNTSMIMKTWLSDKENEKKVNKATKILRKSEKINDKYYETIILLLKHGFLSEKYNRYLAAVRNNLNYWDEVILRKYFHYDTMTDLNNFYTTKFIDISSVYQCFIEKNYLITLNKEICVEIFRKIKEERSNFSDLQLLFNNTLNYQAAIDAKKIKVFKKFYLECNEKEKNIRGGYIYALVKFFYEKFQNDDNLRIQYKEFLVWLVEEMDKNYNYFVCHTNATLFHDFKTIVSSN